MKNSESGKDDVRDVYGLEQSPVPRHPKVTARQRSRILKAFRKALEHRDERLFLEAIRRDLGWQDDTLEFAQAFQVWRKLWGEVASETRASNAAILLSRSAGLSFSK